MFIGVTVVTRRGRSKQSRIIPINIMADSILVGLTLLFAAVTYTKSDSCLDRTYSRAESGPVIAETTIPPLPMGCDAPSGRTCDWYPDCLNRCFYDCAQDDINSAQTYCNEFSTNLWLFSQTGIRWVFNVRKCQQTALANQLGLHPTPSCEEISERVMQSHTACFAEPGAQASYDDSICGLQCQDFLGIFKTVEGGTEEKFKETLMSAFGSSDGQCGSQGTTSAFHQCYNQSSGGYFRLVRFTISAEDNSMARVKRSAECDDNCVSKKITSYVLTEKLGFENTGTLDWIIFAKRLTASTLEISLLFLDYAFLTDTNSQTTEIDMITNKTAELLIKEQLVKADQVEFEVLQVSSCNDFMCNPKNSETVILSQDMVTTTTAQAPSTNTQASTTPIATKASSEGGSSTEKSESDDTSGDRNDDNIISDGSVYQPDNGATMTLKLKLETMILALFSLSILQPFNYC